jgi:replication-associated recombination protein RarA
MEPKMTNGQIRLTEKYRPRKLDEFVGLPKVKAIIRNFLKNPYATSFLFVGPSGVGKTAMALAMAEVLHSKPLHLASETCNYANLDKLLTETEMVPSFWNGQDASFHFILIDEVDSTTATAQRRLLAKLDSSEFISNSVFVFTTNTTKKSSRAPEKDWKKDLHHGVYNWTSLCGERARTSRLFWHGSGKQRAEPGRYQTGVG